jgi:uncharacterized membrane protein YccC
MMVPVPVIQRTRDALATWTGRIAAADPAHQRVRLASRAACSLGVAVAVMEPLTSAVGQPVTVVMLAAIIAIFTSTSTKDGRRRDALVTIAECAVISLAVVVVVAVLRPHPVVADAAFVAVMSGSVLLRRLGPRGFALGQLAFMAYFFALFLDARSGQLPWLSAAVLCGAASTAVVRCLLLPDRPAADLRRLLRAVEARVADLADQVRLWLSATGPDRGDQRTRYLVRAGSRLGEVTLLVERQLEQPVARSLVPDVEALRGLVFDVELAAEHLSDAVRHDAASLSERARAGFVARAGRLSAAANAGRPVRPGEPDALALVARAVRPRPDDAPHLAGAFRRVERAIAELSAVVVSGRLLDGFVAVPMGEAGSTSGPSAQAKALTTRTAVQVAVAGALAMLAGKEISSARWFWAVLAAYVVFVNASSRTATLRRALGRVIGTVLGVAGGLLLGKVVTGDIRLELALIVVLVFAAFWLVAVSYTALVLCFTLTLSTLYAILGTLTWHLLLLRVEETVAGAVIGGVVAVVVLPRRGSDAVDDDIDGVLAATGDLLDRLGAEGVDPTSVRAAVRRVDQRFQDLRLTIQPTVVGLPGPVPTSRRRQLLHVASIRYWARTLAVAAVDGVPFQRLAALRSRVEQVRQLVADGGTADLAVRQAATADPVETALQHLDEALAALVDERTGPSKGSTASAA